MNLKRDMQDYINRYQIIHKRVIKAKRRANVLRAKNKTYAMCHVMNKEVGTSLT
jgi:hypothetical protein